MILKAQEFIIESLEVLIQKLPYISIRYENDMEGTHFVEIKSIKKDRFDDFIYKATLEMTINFITKFPYENISFLKENSLFEIENPTYSKKGQFFELAKELETANQKIVLQPTTQNYNLEFPKKPTVFYQDNFNTYNNQYLSSNSLIKNIFASIINKNEVDTDENYSLAA